MKIIPRPSLLCCLLLAAHAGAATSPPPPQPQQQPPGACAQALQEQEQRRQHEQAPPPRKVNPDAAYDPCRLSDGVPNHDIGNNEGATPQDVYGKLDEWVEWNRRLTESNEAALLSWPGGEDGGTAQHGAAHGDEAWDYWRLSERYGREGGQAWLEPTGAAPAVPEPAGVLSWAAGLTLLAALHWRRRLLNGGKARPAARR